MHDLQNWCAAAVTYLIGLWGLYSGGIMAVLGLILLLARLIQEIPKAWHVLTNKGQKEENE